MASTTVKFETVKSSVEVASEAVSAAIAGTDNAEDRAGFMQHLDRLTWISELAKISADGMITLDSADMEAMWHWGGTAAVPAVPRIRTA